MPTELDRLIMHSDHQVMADDLVAHGRTEPQDGAAEHCGENRTAESTGVGPPSRAAAHRAGSLRWHRDKTIFFSYELPLAYLKFFGPRCIAAQVHEHSEARGRAVGKVCVKTREIKGVRGTSRDKKLGWGMPQLQTALDVNGGPGARFALQLRVLRDSRGAKAPSVQKIADKTGVSRSAIFATLNGRLPSRHTLEAMVVAWGGDPQVWFERRRDLERDLQLARRARSAPAEEARLVDSAPLSSVSSPWWATSPPARAARVGRPLRTNPDQFPDRLPLHTRQLVAKLNTVIDQANLTYREISHRAELDLTGAQMSRRMSDSPAGPSPQLIDAILSVAAPVLGTSVETLRESLPKQDPGPERADEPE